MTPPRQIYSSSLSRRDRAWGRPRRRPSGLLVPWLLRVSLAAFLALTFALLVLPRLG